MPQKIKTETPVETNFKPEIAQKNKETKPKEVGVKINDTKTLH